MQIFRWFILGLFVALNASAANTGILSLKLAAPDYAVKAGNEVIVRLLITNDSDHEITYHDRRGDCDYSVKVLTSAGTEAAKTAYNKHLDCGGGALNISGRNIIVILKPGESKTDPLNVSELFEMSQPGEYSVQVSRNFVGIGQVDSNVVSVNVEP